MEAAESGRETMLRVSLLAIAAVALAACDDESETAAVEGGEAEVAVVEEEATAETEVAAEETEEPEVTEEADLAEVEEPAAEAEADAGLAAGEADPEIAAADEAEEPAATEEAEAPALAEEEAATGGTEQAAAEGEEETPVLTSESPAVETEVITEDEVQEIEVTEGAATGDEQASMAQEGGTSEAMQSYEDWAVGRWAADGSCETDAVVLQENSMSLPGGVNCDNVQVSSAGEGSLAITGMSCEGAENVDEIEIQVSQAADGLTVSRDGQQTQLARCQ